MRSVALIFVLMTILVPSIAFAERPLELFTGQIQTTDGRPGTLSLVFDPHNGHIHYNVQINNGPDWGNLGDYSLQDGALRVNWLLKPGTEQAQLTELNRDELQYRVLRDSSDPTRNNLCLRLRRAPIPADTARNIQAMGKTINDMRKLQQRFNQLQDFNQFQQEFNRQSFKRSNAFGKSLGQIVIE